MLNKNKVFLIIFSFVLFLNTSNLCASLNLILNDDDMGYDIFSFFKMPHLNATDARDGYGYYITFNSALVDEAQTLGRIYLKSGSSINGKMGGGINFSPGYINRPIVDLSLESLTLELGNADYMGLMPGHVVTDFKSLDVGDIEINAFNSTGGIVAVNIDGNLYANSFKVNMEEAFIYTSGYKTIMAFFVTGERDVVFKNDFIINLNGYTLMDSMVDLGGTEYLNLFQTGSFKVMVNENKEHKFSGGVNNIRLNLKNYSDNKIVGDFTLLANSSINIMNAIIKTDSLYGETEKALLIDGGLSLSAESTIDTYKIENKILFDLSAAKLALNIKDDLNVNALLTNKAETTALVSIIANINGSNNLDNVVGGNINVSAVNIDNSDDANVDVALNILNGTTIINGGQLDVLADGKNTLANVKFEDLDFSNAEEVNINVKANNGAVTNFSMRNLTLAGGAANTINIEGAVNFKFLGNKLVVGKDYFDNNNTILNLNGTGPIGIADFSYYLMGAKANDIYLKIEANDSNDFLKVLPATTTNMKLALMGNKLKAGEELTLLPFKNTDLDSKSYNYGIDIINESSIFEAAYYKIIYDTNRKNILLSLNKDAVPYSNGVISTNTNNLWFNNLDKNKDNSISDIEWERARTYTYDDAYQYHNKLSANAKLLYYNLVYKNDVGDDKYKWLGTDAKSIDFRQNMEIYFNHTINNIAQLTGENKNDIIVNFMNDLDASAYANASFNLASLINKNFAKAQINYFEIANYWNNNLLDNKNKEWNIWVKTLIASESIDAQKELQASESKHYTAYMGLDKHFNNYKLGTVLAVGNSDVDFKNNNTQIDANNFLFKVYGEYYINNWLFALTGGGGYMDLSGERYVLGNKHNADYKASIILSDFYAAYTINKNNTSFIPSFSLNYHNVKQNAFEEKGLFSQNFKKQNHDSLLTALALNILTVKKLENGISLTPKLSLGGSYQLLNPAENLFVSFPGQGVTTKLEGLEKEDWSLDLAVGLNAKLSENLNTNIDFSVEKQSNYKNNNLSFVLSYSFY